ncbi:hypothetical protein [Methanomethylovorans sp.]
MLSREKHQIERWEALIFLSIYVSYILSSLIEDKT